MYVCIYIHRRVCKIPHMYENKKKEIPVFCVLNSELFGVRKADQEPRSPKKSEVRTQHWGLDVWDWSWTPFHRLLRSCKHLSEYRKLNMVAKEKTSPTTRWVLSVKCFAPHTTRIPAHKSGIHNRPQT